MDFIDLLEKTTKFQYWRETINKVITIINNTDATAIKDSKNLIDSNAVYTAKTDVETELAEAKTELETKISDTKTELQGNIDTVANNLKTVTDGLSTSEYVIDTVATKDSKHLIDSNAVYTVKTDSETSLSTAKTELQDNIDTVASNLKTVTDGLSSSEYIIDTEATKDSKHLIDSNAVYTAVSSIVVKPTVEYYTQEEDITSGNNLTIPEHDEEAVVLIYADGKILQESSDTEDRDYKVVDTKTITLLADYDKGTAWTFIIFG